MVKMVSKKLITGILFMCLSVATGYADEPKKRITIAIFPCPEAAVSLDKFQPLIAYIKQQAGFDIKLVVPKDFAEFERAIKKGDIDFAFQDPHVYVKSAKLYDKDALIGAVTLKGTTCQAGVVISRKGSGINKLEDLRGKVIIFGPKLSAARWVGAKMLLEENGINIDKDLKAYSNGGCCEDVAFSIHLKAVDAGVVCEHFFEEHLIKNQKLGVDANQLIVVSRTRSVPQRVLAASKNIPNDIVARVNEALLSLDRGKPAHAKILCRAEFGGFQKSKDEDYDGIRMVIRTKTAE